MQNLYRFAVRAVLVFMLCFSLAGLGMSYVSFQHNGSGFEIREQARLSPDERRSVASSRAGITVITTQQRQHAERAPGYIVAIGSDGHVKYYNQTLHSYWDVDPVPDTQATVVYVASERADSECAQTECWRNIVEMVNLSTGKTKRIYQAIVPARGSSRWHDIDLINGTHLIVADIAEDRVFLLDIHHGVIEWSWEVSSTFPPTAGGAYPNDWTHINDVEILPKGRIMVSLRNMDQVVFIHKKHGFQANQTLGEDDNHSIIYEQHNPDYITKPNGGPAVLISDSENNRVVEYQSGASRWNKTWEWSDSRLQWPRDADRLPSGNTLITDTHGGRVLEVAPNGSVVWQVEIIAPYEAERLGTGDESTNGSSATKASLVSRSHRDGEKAQNNNKLTNILLGAVFKISDLIPNIVVNGLLWVFPAWMGARGILLSGVAVAAGASLGFIELLWRYVISLRSPITGPLRLPIIIERK